MGDRDGRADLCVCVEASRRSGHGGDADEDGDATARIVAQAIYEVGLLIVPRSPQRSPRREMRHAMRLACRVCRERGCSEETRKYGPPFRFRLSLLFATHLRSLYTILYTAGL